MDRDGFLADIERAPDVLAGLAGRISDLVMPLVGGQPVLLAGMGSSAFAAATAAPLLRSRGIPAIAEPASVSVGTPAGPEVTDVLISAGGRSVEVIAHAARHAASRQLLVTNAPSSPLASKVSEVIDLGVGVESGGVASLTYRATVAMLWASALGPDVVGDALGRAAEATARLLATRDQWLDAVAEALDGPDGVFIMAPAARECSGQQSALMLREGARRPAVAAETGEWSHTHVYLTRTLDYRALIFPGSPWDSQALDWLHQRGSRYVSVGSMTGGAPDVLAPFPGADDPLTALFTDPLICELLAHRWWVDA